MGPSKSMIVRIAASFVLCSLAACGLDAAKGPGESLVTDDSASGPATTPAARAVTSAIPAERLSSIKSVLPKVAYPALQSMFESDATYWYDHASMTPSYQDTINEPIVGANSNKDWFNLLAGSLHGFGDKIFDRSKKRWQFPFSTTFGTDTSDNVQITNFLVLPAQAGGAPSPVSIWHHRSGMRSSWHWVYPLGSTVGEIIWIKDGSTLLPAEVRIRKRYADGWAANVYRPFPTAADLSAAIKELRPSWASDAKLSAMVSHLGNNATLRSKRLKAVGFTGTFDHEGAIDDLPEFGDPQLVRDLLTKTVFKSAYGAAWKVNGSQKSFAPSAKEALSVVPRSYDAGIVEVSDQSCARCHQNTGNLIEKWFPDVVLYGEIWGKDGVFSFHPFDEAAYPYMGNENRRMNPKLQSAGLITKGSKPSSAAYPSKLFGD